MYEDAELSPTTGAYAPPSGSAALTPVWIVVGLGLVGLHMGLLVLSPHFGYGEPVGAWAYWVLAGGLCAAGALYLAVAARLRRRSGTARLMAWVVVIGAILRGVMLFSTPMLEVDFYRYLWDGGVTAHGVNPYRYAPDDVLAGTRGDELVPRALRDLAADSDRVIERVHFPALRTVYPATAQGVFALAHWLGPWQLTAWRLVLMGFDAATLVLLLALLRTLRLPVVLAVIYWWNPLLLKEFYNSAHVDVVALPLVLGAVLLALRGRRAWAAALLALGAGVKVWPVLLLPVVVGWPGESDESSDGWVIFGAIAALLSLPVLLGGLGMDLGFAKYGVGWEMNDALFMIFLWAAQAGAWIVGGSPEAAALCARIVVAGVLAAWIILLTRRPFRSDTELCERCLWVVAAAFLLSPTQFPWYYLWMLPFLAIRPRLSLMLLTALLPLYYLRFYFKYFVGAVGPFDNGVVWIEYVPVYILLVREWWVSRKGTASPAEA